MTAVYGVELDSETRCVHWHGATDVVAIAFACCGRFYACASCHEALEQHAAQVWPRSRFDERAVLCGACGTSMSIDRYLEATRCPSCGHDFNPGCRTHRHLYFAESVAQSG